MPKYDEGLDDLNNIFYEKFGKLPSKISIRAYEITRSNFEDILQKKLIKSIDLGETSIQNRFKYRKRQWIH